MHRAAGWERTRGLAVATALLVTLVGCPAVPRAQLVPVDDVDFEHLQSLVHMVVDLNDLTVGWLSEADLKARYASAGRVELRSLPQVNITYMLVTDDSARRQSLFIPGTTNLEHVKLDLQIGRVQDDELGISIHAGFREAALAIRADLAGTLHADYELHLVGYSLGGCAAAVLGKYFQHDGLDLAEIVTLGQATVTDAAGAAAFADLPLLRLIAGDDGIPRVKYEDYVQFGPALILLDGPYVVRLPADDPDIDLMTSLAIDARDLIWLDHVSYRARIDSKVGAEVFEVRFEDRQTYLARPVIP